MTLLRGYTSQALHVLNKPYHAVVYGLFPKEKILNIRFSGDVSEITTSETKEVRDFFLISFPLTEDGHTCHDSSQKRLFQKFETKLQAKMVSLQQ